MKRAFSLIEALVATFIVGVILIGMGGLWQFMFKTTDWNTDRSIAYNLARYQMEEIRAMGYMTSRNPTFAIYFDREGLNRSSTPHAGGGYSVRGALTTVASGANAVLYKIEITVYNTTNTAVAHTGTYLTYGGL